ncbi:hypothetical protein GW17_00009518 [Ensete ventricosum]|nr:hypothetical protein GW17_00009518 [Ensete ventricosum]
MGFLKRGSFACLCVAVLVVFLVSPPSAAQPLSPSQYKTLLRLQRLLEYQPPLVGWSNATDLCYLPASPSLAVSCSTGRVTGLSIVGVADRPLSANFSSGSLFTTLARLSGLTTLSLVSLGLWGPLPGKVDRFSSLQVLNLSSNYFSGTIPPEISNITSLQNLCLTKNSFDGTVPDLSPLTTLTQLDLSGNRLGPELPYVSSTLVSLLLQNNSFHDRLPPRLASFGHLQKLDLSSNHLHGWIPAFLFSLPSMQHLDLSGNRMTGEVPANLSCGSQLLYVDISDNLLVGGLPSCIQANSSNRVVLISGNCLNSDDFELQHPNSFCNQGAMPAILPSANKISGSKSKLGLILGIVGGVIAGAVLIGLLVLLLFRKIRTEDAEVNNTFHSPTAGKSLMQVAPRSTAEAMEISLSCTSRDPKQRPSIDDVLWNLQYSVQVQDGWTSSESTEVKYVLQEISDARFQHTLQQHHQEINLRLFDEMPEPAVSQASETRSRKKRSRQFSEEKAKTVSARIPHRDDRSMIFLRARYPVTRKSLI